MYEKCYINKDYLSLLLLLPLYLTATATPTFVMPQILVAASVPGQRPGLPFVALTELHHAALVQLHPRSVSIGHLQNNQGNHLLHKSSSKGLRKANLHHYRYTKAKTRAKFSSQG